MRTCTRIFTLDHGISTHRASVARTDHTYSYSANRNPIHEWMPPKKLITLLYTPGMLLTASGTPAWSDPLIQRSGFHSFASGPQSSTEQLTAKVGIQRESPLLIAILSCSTPSRSTYGRESGSTSLWTAVRLMPDTGEFRRRASRTTASS
jgi:hypothetical protein